MKRVLDVRPQLNWIERLTTDQKVVGSIPAGRAIYFKRDVAQLGSALDLGSRGRRFESCHPDHDLNFWRGSLVGQSVRFIPGRSWVRVPPSLPFDCLGSADPQLSWSELPAHNRLVVGSSPTGSTKSFWRNTQVVEGSGLENRQVGKLAPGFESQFLRHSKLNLIHRGVEQSGSSSGS